MCIGEPKTLGVALSETSREAFPSAELWEVVPKVQDQSLSHALRQSNQGSSARRRVGLGRGSYNCLKSLRIVSAFGGHKGKTRARK